MRLQISLIPALAYALMMLFSDMTGMTGVVEKPSQKQQLVVLQSTCQDLNRHNNHVFIAKNGQLFLSTGYGNGNLEWKIPYAQDMKQVN